ncbi:hypothetical protein BG32_10170 [Mesotoga sp. HF07.pep.5.2.highcov]|uniref:hypothetical protein n=1 Tax=Mesotoga TaxID=1184396 RepID=UPI0002CC22A0|nr:MULTISPECIES: hypothetical protein [Mesotoga]MCB1224041.1 hypothetical protein [Mesotoga sp.]MCP5457981.1 hypothetical protein [Thermotogota bacterium]CCU85133.1 hypothetical protein PHOSAC3_150133 [Mesotoga infera]MCP5461199.1 hypothetical protein [Thermotogota bacterium]RLL92267.1 hypothetical protein BG32_10170 [Mesotoga sp. HF07.pep.5.2.highcov]
MTTGRIDASPASRVALGWFVKEIEGVKVLQHGCRVNGQISLLAVLLDLNLSAVLTNSNDGSKATSIFTRMVIEKLLGLSPIILVSASDELESRKDRWEVFGRSPTWISSKKTANCS